MDTQDGSHRVRSHFGSSRRQVFAPGFRCHAKLPHHIPSEQSPSGRRKRNDAPGSAPQSALEDRGSARDSEILGQGCQDVVVGAFRGRVVQHTPRQRGQQGLQELGKDPDSFPRVQ
eukprot:4029161-Pyramimonas_sp.AAC.1